MNEYQSIYEQRVCQFAHYLELMETRQGKITSGNTFITFEEGGGPTVTWDAKTADGANSSRKDGGATFTSLGVGEESWRDSTQDRFVQFSFNPRYFDIDLPNTTLYPEESKEILKWRRGFFYAEDRQQFEHPSEKLTKFQPLRRVYIYGDAREAAEDMAFIWFKVWKFPVDWEFCVTSGAFWEETDWEHKLPIGFSGLP